LIFSSAGSGNLACQNLCCHKDFELGSRTEALCQRFGEAARAAIQVDDQSALCVSPHPFGRQATPRWPRSPSLAAHRTPPTSRPAVGQSGCVLPPPGRVLRGRRETSHGGRSASTRGHRVKTEGLALPLGRVSGLAEDQTTTWRAANRSQRRLCHRPRAASEAAA